MGLTQWHCAAPRAVKMEEMAQDLLRRLWGESRRSEGGASQMQEGGLGGGLERIQKADVRGLANLIHRSASVSLMSFTFLLTIFTNPTVA